MEILTAVAISFGLLIAGILFITTSFSWVRKDEVSQRLESYVVEQDSQRRQAEIAMRARRMELRGTFSERIFYPFLRQIARLFARLLPARGMASLDRRLQIIGNPIGLRSREFLGLQFAFAIVGIILAYFLYSSDSSYGVWLSIMTPVVALILPSLWLNRSVRNRQNQFRKELPNVIDILSICTSAGLGFDQSMQRVSEEWRTQLSGEIGRVVSEMEMGISRKDALRNLANRIDISELSTFVSIIIQSDQLGMSIADTLHTLAQQMRVEWRFRAQEEARKVPVKILIPLAFFIFPAMLAVILGPSLPALVGLMETVQ